MAYTSIFMVTEWLKLVIEWYWFATHNQRKYLPHDPEYPAKHKQKAIRYIYIYISTRKYRLFPLHQPPLSQQSSTYQCHRYSQQ